jgi:hypothetical protein
VKNFQLCCASAEDPDQVVLQFGRVGKHKFNMDLRFPLSPMQVCKRSFCFTAHCVVLMLRSVI